MRYLEDETHRIDLIKEDEEDFDEEVYPQIYKEAIENLNEEQGGSVIDMGFDQEEQVDTS